MRKTFGDHIRINVDFPHERILFRDVTMLFSDLRGICLTVDQLPAPDAGIGHDKVERPVQ